jgi:hypothetical protein
MDKEKLNKMTLRQVMEYTKDISINDGGLSILFEKIVSEIEYLERMFNGIHKHITTKHD